MLPPEPLHETSSLRAASESFRSRRLRPLIADRVERERERIALAAADRYTSILFGESDTEKAKEYRDYVYDVYGTNPIGEELASKIVRERIDSVLSEYPITEHLSTGANHDDIRFWAEERADLCMHNHPLVNIEIAQKIFGKNIHVTHARTLDPIWWRRNARKHLRRAREALWRSIAPLHLHKGVSPEMSYDSFEQDEKNTEYMSRVVAVGPKGQRVKMSSPAQQAARRYAELMLRSDALAKRNQGKLALFVTVTVPEQWHPTTTKSGKREENPHYDFSVGPREAQKWLNKQWSRLRATKFWGRSSVDFVRVAEPHGDGTPHWHILCWVSKEDKDELISLIRHYFIEDDASEARKRHGVEIDILDDDAMPVVAYLAKYIGKQVRQQERITGTEKANDSNPVAWRRAHNIRSFATSAKKATLWRLAFNGRLDHTSDLYLSVLSKFVKDRDVQNFEVMARFFGLVYEVRCNRYGEQVERLAGVANVLTGEVTYLEKWQLELDAVGPPSGQDEDALLAA